MSKKRNLRKVEFPCLWTNVQNNGLVKVVLASQFGSKFASKRKDAKIVAEFFLPSNKFDEFSSTSVQTIKNRLKHEFGIDLGEYSRMISNTNPFSNLEKE